MSKEEFDGRPDSTSWKDTCDGCMEDFPRWQLGKVACCGSVVCKACAQHADAGFCEVCEGRNAGVAQLSESLDNTSSEQCVCCLKNFPYRQMYTLSSCCKRRACANCYTHTDGDGRCVACQREAARLAHARTEQEDEQKQVLADVDYEVYGSHKLSHKSAWKKVKTREEWDGKADQEGNGIMADCDGCFEPHMPTAMHKVPCCTSLLCRKCVGDVVRSWGDAKCMVCEAKAADVARMQGAAS